MLPELEGMGFRTSVKVSKNKVVYLVEREGVLALREPEEPLKLILPPHYFKRKTP